jgi:hypothetical protein
MYRLRKYTDACCHQHTYDLAAAMHGLQQPQQACVLVSK